MSDLALFDFDDAGSTFQMQAWSSTEQQWVPMEKGSAPAIWRPRALAVDAVIKCMEWTGLVFIPAMQVVDTADGSIVWRESRKYPDAGAPIVPAWAKPLYEQVRQALQEFNELEDASA
jgi:hypothetical protein